MRTAPSSQPVTDLRSAIARLQTFADEYIETDVTVDPEAELSGVYRHVGAAGTVQRPTRRGPAMMFNSIKGHPDFRVLIGLLCSRQRVARLLGVPAQALGQHLLQAVQHAVAPRLIEEAHPVCQQVVHRAEDPDFDLRRLLPAPTNTPEDAGPYFTMGLAYAADPETGAHDVTIHRLCVQGKDEISMYFVPGRHLDQFRIKAEQAGKALPITISIGVDPAIEIATCFEPPTTPLGFDELSIAGGLRGQAVELVRAVSVDARAIAHAEVVIEGELVPDYRVREDQNTGTGKAMPEFPGYTGEAKPAVPVIKVKAVTHRHQPILQTCIGSSDEHTNLAGIPTEASILGMTEKALPGFVLNVHCPSPGTGKYMAVLQVRKRSANDEGRQRQAALLAFAAFSELKHVFLVDEDVDPFDLSDVIWAMTTRYQADVDTVMIPGIRCHPLDPSQDPAFSPSIRGHGISCKTIYDCTVPFDLKAQFQRSQFMDVDVSRFVPGCQD